VGDGTTSVVLLAGEFLRECKPFVEEGVHPQIIIRSFRQAVAVAIEKIKEIAVTLDKKNPEKLRELLQRCAATTLSSKVGSVCVCVCVSICF
jgi:T-complex protein 1 subunit eta